jgi:hypothetical protein
VVGETDSRLGSLLIEKSPEPERIVAVGEEFFLENPSLNTVPRIVNFERL